MTHSSTIKSLGLCMCVFVFVCECARLCPCEAPARTAPFEGACGRPDGGRKERREENGGEQRWEGGSIPGQWQEFDC